MRVVDHYDLKLLRTGQEQSLAMDIDDMSQPDSLAGLTPTPDSVPAPAPIPRVAVQAVQPNTAGTLPHLAAALRNADKQLIRIMHYGDSQIEEDRITATLRRRLQAKYGGHGVGLVPLHQTIPTLTLKQRLYINNQVQSVQGGPKRYIIYGLRSMRLPDDDHRYGPMAQVAEMNDDLVRGSEDILLTLQPLAGGSVHRQVKLLADTSIHMSITAGATDTVRLQGRGRVYGLSLESATGVIVDNIPMRGCMGTIFTKLDSMQLAQFYSQSHTRLIILQYGGNAIPMNKKESTIRGICYGLRDQVRYLRTLAPEADILFIGPSDMIEIDENGEAHTNPLVSIMDNTLRTLMTRENVPYFSLYAAMGGEGSMIRWQQIGWAGSDGVHFTRSGADKAADLLWDWLEPMLNDGIE